MLNSFHLNGHTLGFHPQTQKLEPQYMSRGFTLGVKGFNDYYPKVMQDLAFSIQPKFTEIPVQCKMESWNFFEKFIFKNFVQLLELVPFSKKKNEKIIQEVLYYLWHSTLENLVISSCCCAE